MSASLLQTTVQLYACLKFNFQFVAFQITMRTLNPIQKSFPRKRKTPSVKSMDNNKKVKINCKQNHVHHKVPQLINELQENLKMLKRYYYEQHPTITPHFKQSSRAISRPSSSNAKHAPKAEDCHLEQEATTLAEIDDLKKSFLSMHGYNTNNIVELYNFYKKNLEKSTKLFGSTSMSNMINMTHNHSELREKGRPNSGLVLSTTQDNMKDKQLENRQIKYQQNFCSQLDPCTLPAIDPDRKSNSMVNVANLLAEKKKISRKNICENMNSENLLNQAKRKLHRPQPSDNIQKMAKLKQNYRNQNIRISPSRKIKNIEGSKEKSSEKKQNNKQKDIQYKQNIEIKPIQSQVIEAQNSEQQKIVPIIVIKTVEAHELHVSDQMGTQNQRDGLQKQKQAEANEAKDLKSAKSSRSVKSIRSPNSIRSPSLNKAVLDISKSFEGSGNKKGPSPSYFVPKVHNNLHDSLLDCEITPKDQSKILDLQSIPFDF